MLPLIPDKTPKATSSDLETVHDILETVIRFLGMDVAFVSAQVGIGAPMRHQAVAGNAIKGQLEDSLILAEKYCEQIGRGNLPPAISDSQGMPILKSTTFTKNDLIRAFICVPLYDQEQNPTGLLCGFSATTKPRFEHRDLKVLSILSRVASSVLNRHLAAQKARQDAVVDVMDVISTQDFEIYLQPIVSLSNNRPMAVEALCRFSNPSQRTTFGWFELAAKAEMSNDLELAAIEKALGYLPNLPDRMYMTLNAGPDTLADARLHELLSGVPADRVVIELTEHHVIDDLPLLARSLDVLRDRRIGIAIDDLGAGYAGLNTVLGLNADVLKLDRELVSNIHNDPAKQALTKAMIHFARETDAFLIAEGVEKAEENVMLRQLGARLGQGYYYERPAAADEQIRRLNASRAHWAGLRQVS